MKNYKAKLFVLSVAALLGLGGLAGCSKVPTAPEIGVTSFVEDKTEDKDPSAATVKDEIGVGVKLNAATGNSSVSMTLSSNMGFQEIKNSDGTVNLRFIARFTGLEDVYSVKVVRSVTAADGTKVLPEGSLPVLTAYTSLSDEDKVRWDGDFTTEGTVYYLVYTLKNIPSSHASDEIAVEFEAETWQGMDKSVSVTANVLGFEHEATSIPGLKFTLGSSSSSVCNENEAYVDADTSKLNSLTEVTIPEDVYVSASSYNSHVIKAAKVVSIGNPNASYSSYASNGFQDASKLTAIHLPSTIRVFSYNAFQGCTSLKEIELPEDLVEIKAAAFHSSYGYSIAPITTIYWNAKALTTVGDTYYSSSSSYGLFINKVETLVMGPKVTAVPNKELFKSYAYNYGYKTNDFLPASIEFKGTEASRAAMKEASPKCDIFSVTDYVCSDTAKVDINIHIGDGTLTYDGEERTGDYLTSAFAGGRKFAYPGSPVAPSGKMFGGWFLDSAYEKKASFPLTLNDEGVDLYAKYIDPLPGSSSALAIDLVTDGSVKVETTDAMKKAYFKFTAPEKASVDRYYFQITSADVTSGNRSDYSNDIHVYKDAAFTQDVSVTSASAANAVKETVTGKPHDIVGVKMNPGETYYFTAAAYDDTSASATPVYANLTIDFFAVDGDLPSEAKAIEKGKGETFTDNRLFQEQIYEFYKFVADDSGYSVSSTPNQSNPRNMNASFEIYNEDFSKSFGKVSGSYAASKNINGFTVGDTYYVAINHSYDSHLLEGDGSTFLLDKLPAGLSYEDPIEVKVGEDVATTYLGGNYQYFKMHLEAGKTYEIWATIAAKASTYSGSRDYELRPSDDAEAAAIASGKLSFGTYDGDYNKNKSFQVTPSEGGDYTLKIKTDYSSYSSSSDRISNIKVLELADSLSDAVMKNGEWKAIKPSLVSKYTLSAALAEPLDGATASLELRSGNIYASATKITDASIQTFNANTVYYIKAISSNEGDVKLTALPVEGTLAGKSYVGKQMCGAKNGSSSYWKLAGIDQYGTATGEGFVNNAEVKEVSSINGIAKLSFTLSGKTSYGYTDGEVLWMQSPSDGTDYFLSSKAPYSYSLGAKYASTAGYDTSSANAEDKILILSVRNNGEEAQRIYACRKGDVVYLGCSVEFTAGTDFSAKDSSFTIKDSQGNVIGSYTCSADHVIVAA